MPCAVEPQQLGAAGYPVLFGDRGIPPNLLTALEMPRVGSAVGGRELCSPGAGLAIPEPQGKP